MTQAKKVKYMAAAMLIVASAFALNVAQASIRDLAEDGYTVAIVQNPTISLADDVATTKRIIDAQTAAAT